MIVDESAWEFATKRYQTLIDYHQLSSNDHRLVAALDDRILIILFYNDIWPTCDSDMGSLVSMAASWS